MNKLPHEIQDLCDLVEEAADFLQWCTAGESEESEGVVLIDGSGNPFPVDVAGFRKWEQAVRSIKQMVLLSK